LTLRTQSFHNGFLSLRRTSRCRCLKKKTVNFCSCPTCVCAQEDLRRWGNFRVSFFQAAECTCSQGACALKNHAWQKVTRIGLSDYCETMLCPKTVEVDTTREIDTLDCTTGGVVKHSM
jgi:hypothetical protein